MDWWDLAACIDEDPELFFPVGTAGHALVVQVAAAKAVCRRCPVKARCLDWGLRSGHEDDQRLESLTAAISFIHRVS